MVTWDAGKSTTPPGPATIKSTSSAPSRDPVSWGKSAAALLQFWVTGTMHHGTRTSLLSPQPEISDKV